MSKFKFELNKKGVGELLNSDEMRSMLDGIANSAEARCGPGYVGETVKSKDRLKVFVRAQTNEAKADNLKNNTILKAVQK